MATATLTLNTWKVEYHETMAAAERAHSKTREFTAPTFIRHVAGLLLLAPFWRVNNETDKLISLLEKLESYPSAILLEEDARKIPDYLNELFKTMCVVIQETESLDLHEVPFLKKQVVRLRQLSQQINGFAVRYGDAQTKLLSRVPVEEVSHYQESFAAYGNCKPTTEQTTDDDDVKRDLLHF
jgi:hypothetical protein